MKRWMTVGALAGALLALTGCVGSPGPFDAARKAADELPAAATHYIAEGDPSSSHYQGNAGDRDLYLLRGTGTSRFCLVYTDGTEEGSGSTCGGGSWLKASIANGAEYEAQIDGFPDDLGPGEEQVSPWVRLVHPAREG